MGRYVFKSKDLAPLRKFIDQPAARLVLETAVPVKRFEQTSGFTEDVVEVSVTIASGQNPDGVPLHAILRAAKEEDPTVVGITVRGDRLFLKRGGEPKAEQTQRLRKLLDDPQRLLALRASPPPKALSLTAESLEALLLDEGTPDAEWLRAFRRYAVDNLIKAPKRKAK
ncbi:hypothetical protein LY474_34035 [Myxococcus stipitatus]|uniref:hypothetical protein n=1 Tax=Myxococcus stipitatus TaxID=83455 RepID=UPI001F444BDE|nr:hypothetical protein [Myxococcus stipitatus]MCE9672838.1 hypothetical protein [Myxococcus stipitatus]